jgi:hypothetical protein
MERTFESYSALTFMFQLLNFIVWLLVLFLLYRLFKKKK